MNEHQILLDRAFQLHQSGHIREALDLYNRVLPWQQNNAALLDLVGTANLAIGQFEQGIALLERSLGINPNNSAAHNNIGLALQTLRRLDKALESYGNACAIKPDFAEAHYNAGNVLRELGQLDQALARYDRALAIKPGFVEAHYNRGTVLRELGRLDEALASYDKALAIKPSYPEVCSNRGNVLRELGRLDEALASYDKALAIKPDYTGAYYNRGISLRELGRLDEALASYDKALILNPGFADAHGNRGIALQDLGRLDEALASYDRALTIKPDNANAQFSKSGLLILLGNYLEGWPLYEWRLKRDETRGAYYTFPKPAWRGIADIRGKKLLIYAEQGFGDVIQFCRYLPQLHALGAELIVEVPKPLVALISTLKCPMSVVAKGAPLPEFDAYCPMMSLPHIFKTMVETIPAEIPYLFSDAEKVRRWRERLGNKDGLKIGLAWSGSTNHKRDQVRSIALEKLLPIAGLASVEWHALQKEYRQRDLEILKQHPEIQQHQDGLGDFSDTAALIACMDLVISVDTSVAHLAGAMGKPVWLLLTFSPDFRWMLDRKDSPWYPTAELYRQPSFDDWQSVIVMVQQDVVKLTKKLAGS